MLTPEQQEAIRAALAEAKNPLFYFHDDPDGLASFCLCYRAVNEGRGFCVKAFPHLTEQFAKVAHDFGADRTFILDIAMADQEFIDALKMPTLWIDHHEPQKRERVTYINPRAKDPADTKLNVPTPALIWEAIGAARESDLWLATAGCIGDWHLPSFVNEFREKWPGLLPKKIKRVDQALFDSPLTPLIQTMSFNLKGPTSEVNKAVKIFTRIDSPYEILRQETPRGKFLWKKYEQIKRDYDALKAQALKVAETDKKVVLFLYSEDRLSLTKDLANELLFLFPDRLIILGREKEGEMRCSLRTGPKMHLSAALKRALVGIDGYGGGHENACGCGIKKHDFDRFVNNLRAELGL